MTYQGKVLVAVLAIIEITAIYFSSPFAWYWIALAALAIPVLIIASVIFAVWANDESWIA